MSFKFFYSSSIYSLQEVIMNGPVIKSYSNKFFSLQVFDMEERFKVFNDDELEYIANRINSEWGPENFDLQGEILEKLERFGLDSQEVEENAFKTTVDYTDTLIKLRKNIKKMNLEELKELESIEFNQDASLHINFILDEEDVLSIQTYRLDSSVEEFDGAVKAFESKKALCLEKLKEALLNPKNKQYHKTIERCLSLLKDN